MRVGIFLAAVVTAFACAAFPPLLIPVIPAVLVLLSSRSRRRY